MAITWPVIPMEPFDIPPHQLEGLRRVAQKVAKANPSLTREDSLMFKARWGVKIPTGLPPQFSYIVDFNPEETGMALAMAHSYGHLVMEQWMTSEEKEAFRRQWGRMIKKLAQAESLADEDWLADIKEYWGIKSSHNT